MALNIALIIHILIVLVGLVYNIYEYQNLPPRIQANAEFTMTWFGKASFVSLLVLLYRIGG